MRKRWLFAAVLLLGLAAGYSGYWFWLAGRFERTLDQWIEQQRLAGYDIRFAARSRPTGFPLAAMIALDGILVVKTGGDRRWNLRLEAIAASLAPWAPLRLRLRPRDKGLGYRLALTADGSETILILTPAAIGAAIDIDDRDWTAAIDADTATLMRDDEAIATARDVHATIEGRAAAALADSELAFAAGAGNIDSPLIQGPLGGRIGAVTAQGRIVGWLPPGDLARSLRAWSEAGGIVDLARLDVTDWGPLSIAADGTLAFDAALQPIYAGTAALRGYAETIDSLAAAGMMSGGQAVAAKLALGATAKPAADGSGQREAHVPVTAQDGVLFAGPIKLLTLPRLDWR